MTPVFCYALHSGNPAKVCEDQRGKPVFTHSLILWHFLITAMDHLNASLRTWGTRGLSSPDFSLPKLQVGRYMPTASLVPVLANI